MASDLEKIIDKMLSRDRFSRWMNIRLLEVTPGSCSLSMRIREDMLNGFDIVHGGITFSLADTALAVASNGYNRVSLALNASISYPEPVRIGDEITAKAKEISRSNRIGVYQILLINQKEMVVAIFNGTVYRTSKLLVEDA